MTLLLYLGKVFLCSGILLGYYRLFLQNNRFHHYNRFYLQATLLLSVILPFIKIPVWRQSQNPVNQVVYKTLDVLTVTYGEQEGMVGGTGTRSHLFSTENILYCFYAVGVMVLLGVLLRSLLYIKRISRQYPYEPVQNLKFYSTNEPGTPFSFFRSIFWSADLPFNSAEGQQIFRHELFHVQQKHSIDIIVAEIITALFWFNPFFYLLKKELKAIHEFLADQYAASSGNDRYAYAELLVMQTLKTRNIPVSNYFFQNHIKRRIAMITQPNSTRYSYTRRLMVLPVLALLCSAIVLQAQQPIAQTATATAPLKKTITLVIDAGHGGIDNGAVSNGVKEKDIALQLSLKIQQLAPAYNINVVMTRTTDELPANTTTIIDGLRARTTITQQANADVFIAIHTNFADANDLLNAHSGFEVYVPNQENDPHTQESKKFGTALVQSIGKLYTTNPSLLQRKQNIWVLNHSSCPALLIECGFITNEKDVDFVKNNQEAIAQKILEAVVNYKNPSTTTNSNSTTGTNM